MTLKQEVKLINKQAEQIRKIKKEYIEAINELLAYTKNLEQTVVLLQKTKKINDK